MLKSFTLASFDAEVWASIRWRWPLDVGMDLCVGSADTVSLALDSFVVASEGGLAGVQQLL